MINDSTRGQQEHIYHLIQFPGLQLARLLSNNRTSQNIPVLSLTVCFKLSEKIKQIQTADYISNVVGI